MRSLVLPLKKLKLTTAYKDSVYVKNWTHFGIDLGGSIGDPIYAPEDGTIKIAGCDNVFGLAVCLVGKYVHKMWHMNKVTVMAGQKVKKGLDKIGEVGKTGKHTTGPHLHWEVDKDTKCYQYTPTLTIGNTTLFKMGTDTTLNPLVDIVGMRRLEGSLIVHPGTNLNSPEMHLQYKKLKTIKETLFRWWWWISPLP